MDLGSDEGDGRTAPNVLITGTPGVGKSSLCQMVSQMTNIQHLNLGPLVEQHQLHDGRDTQFDSWILNEDKVCDYLEPVMEKGGVLLESHGSDYFPERWFDLVIVLTCNNTALWDRLVARGYQVNKIQENVQCEIMQVCLAETRESYDERIIKVLPSENVEQLNSNATAIVNWINQFKQGNQ